MKRRRTKEGLFIELEERDLPESAYTHKLPVGAEARGAGGKRIPIRISAEAVRLLGDHGRLLGASKTYYQHQHPDHDVYFNACIFKPDGTEIWFGDLDLTLEQEKLERLAERVGEIILTPEHPYRFDGLDPAAREDRRVRIFRPRRDQDPDGS